MKADRMPGMKPRAISCYICGQGYGTTSIMIHVKACMKKWDLQQQQLPPERRRKCPPPPPDFLALTGQKKGLTSGEIDDLNEIGFKHFNHEALEKCPYCNRSFNPQAYTRHMNVCTEDRPLNPLPDKEGGKLKNQRFSPLDDGLDEDFDQPVARGKEKPVVAPKIGQKPVTSGVSKPGQMGVRQHEVPMKKGSKVATQNELIDDFLNDKKPQSRTQVGKPVSLGEPKPTSAIGTKKPALAPKMATKTAPLNPEFSKLQPLSQPSANAFDEVKPKGIGGGKAGFERALAMAEKQLANLDLVPCSKCGRKFVSDRIAKHQKACKVNSKPKKVKVFHKKITDKEKEKMKKLKTSKWKQQHAELSAQMQYMRKMKDVQAAGGNIRDMPPPPPSANSNFLECPYCSRKFNPEAHSKHVNICKNVVNKPKPVPGKVNVQPKPMAATSNISKQAPGGPGFNTKAPSGTSQLTKTNPLTKPTAYRK